MALNEVRDRFFRSEPIAAKIDECLKSGRNLTPAFYMSKIEDEQDLDQVKLLLVRLGPTLERKFAINGEVALFITPWRDFQRRSFNSITSDLIKISNSCQQKSFGERRFSPSRRLVLVSTPDENAQAKVTEWSRETDGRTTLVALSNSELRDLDQQSVYSYLVSEILKRLGEQNLYKAQNPVAGQEFYGRSVLLRDLAASVRFDQNPAIFGLRRSGKTSVIRELKRMLLEQAIVVSIVDLQPIDAQSIREFSRSIVSGLVEDLRSAKASGLKVYVGSEADVLAAETTMLSLAGAVRKIAARNMDLRIVLALDEIEHLEAVANSDPHAVKTFLGALRSTAQASQNVSLIFSGVANTMFLSSSISNSDTRVDNPMFGQVNPTYLKPFTAEETAAMIRGIGVPMFLEWTDEAVARVHELTGGSPYFARELAATIWDKAASERGQENDFSSNMVIDLDQVVQIEVDWGRRASTTWTEVVLALELHHPDAAYLLSPDVDNDSLNDWISGDESVRIAADCLLELGLLETQGTRFVYTESLLSLRRLGQGAAPRTVRAAGDERLLALIEAGESQVIEFKSTLRFDLRSRKKEKYIEDAVVKTVAAFANSSGGTLVVGVADDGALLGINLDLSLYADSLDRLERWLRGDLLSNRLGLTASSTLVECDFHRLRGTLLLELRIKPSLTEIIMVDENEVYVRNGNQTNKLSGRELIQFVSSQ